MFLKQFYHVFVGFIAMFVCHVFFTVVRVISEILWYSVSL